MVTALVLLNVERKLINRIADEIAGLKGVSEVYSVSGTYDLVCIIRTASNEDLAEIVTGKMLQIEGILKSETVLALKCYSQHDLEAMFDIGLK